VYFFIWTALAVVPLQTGLLSADVLGLKLPMDRIQSDVRMAVPDYNGTFTIGIAGEVSKEVPVRWAGMRWTPQRIGFRLLPVAYAFVLVLLAALCFDRFDATARAPAKSSRLRRLADSLGGGVMAKLPELTLRPLAALTGRTVFGRMLLAELRLMLQGLPWWWHLIALGLWIGSLVPEPAFARAYLLPCLWVWPVFLWSAMGTRESRFRTDQVLFSSPRPLGRQLLALWVAGILVTTGLASGVLLRLLIAGDLPAVCAVAAAALFIPSWALASGVWSGGGKMFEAVYIMAWYLGPINHQPSLDFMATTDTAIAAKFPVVMLLIAGTLFWGALLGRRRQLGIA
jgi:hypothetical protein